MKKDGWLSREPKRSEMGRWLSREMGGLNRRWLPLFRETGGYTVCSHRWVAKFREI